MKGQQLKDELLFLVDEDTAAFNKVMAAFGLPKDSAEEKAARSKAIQTANQYAAEIPLKVMETASRSYDLLAEMAEKGNPASISDVGVGLLATRACIEGAAMNVRINLSGLKDEKVKAALQEKMERLALNRNANPERTDVWISKLQSSESEVRWRNASLSLLDPSTPLRIRQIERVNSLALFHASQLVTLAGPKRPRVGDELSDLAIIEDGGMLVRDGVIVAIGTFGRNRARSCLTMSRLSTREIGWCCRVSWTRMLILSSAGIEWMNSRCGRVARLTKRSPPAAAGFVRPCARPARRAKPNFSRMRKSAQTGSCAAEPRRWRRSPATACRSRKS